MSEVNQEVEQNPTNPTELQKILKSDLDYVRWLKVNSNFEYLDTKPAHDPNSMPAVGMQIVKPFTLSGVGSANKLWLAKYVSGQGHKDAPTVLDNTSQYMIVGGREYGVGSYKGIGFGYVGETKGIAPVFVGSMERNSDKQTSADLVFATRNSTDDVPLTVRLSVTSEGQITAASDYAPKVDQDLVPKKYMDDIVAKLEARIEALEKKK